MVRSAEGEALFRQHNQDADGAFGITGRPVKDMLHQDYPGSVSNDSARGPAGAEPAGTQDVSYNGAGGRLLDAIRAGDAGPALDAARALLSLTMQDADILPAPAMARFSGYWLYRIVTDGGAPAHMSPHRSQTLEFLAFHDLTMAKDGTDIDAWAVLITTMLCGSESTLPKTHYSPVVNTALKYISRHFAEKITLNGTASALNINPSYLSHLFAKEMGISFTRCLNETRIRHSLGLIYDTRMSLLEIAGSSGFEDQSYFTKVFKNIMGDSPKNYRLVSSAIA